MNRKLIAAIAIGSLFVCRASQAQTFTPIDPNAIETTAAKSATPAKANPDADRTVGASSAATTQVAQKPTQRSEAAPSERHSVAGQGPKTEAVRPPALPDDLLPNGKVERVVFDRRPISVVMDIGRERLVHLPWEAAIEIPPDADLDIQIIGTTAFLRAEKPVSKTRVVAQGMNGEGYIPLDITVRRGVAVPDELEVYLKPQGSTAAQNAQRSGDDPEEDAPAPDMVELSRYCLQQVYAPLRLVRPLPGLRQVEVRAAPVAGLYRGGAIQTMPIGAWRSTDQYVTAVRFSNRATTAIELDMEQLRGRWLAATPQHWRLTSQGSEADTTVVCLISEQPFDAAR